jgi:hypothetical protein
MGRQEELLGQENEERKLVNALGELKRSQLLAEASRVLAQAKKGRRFSNGYIAKLQKRLLSYGKQAQRLGWESEEMQLAVNLGALQR